MSTSPDSGPGQSTTSPNGVPLAAAPFVFDLTEGHVDAADLEIVQVFSGSFGSVRAYHAPDGVYISCQAPAKDKTCFLISIPEYLGKAAKLAGAQLMETGIITQERTLAALQGFISEAIKTERVRVFARVGSDTAPQQPIAASVWHRVTDWQKGQAETVAGARLFDVRIRPAGTEALEGVGVEAREAEVPRRDLATRDPRGRKSELNWEKILVEAARYMYERRRAGSQKALFDHLRKFLNRMDGGPSDTALKDHIGPIWRVFKQIDDG